ncbi:MAG: siroheme synthase [Sphingomonadaceae bacterium]|nr:siroheme synthase [Sphingomonadaceae bacterium]NBU77899.1 siroheme synthase [Sphingomonadaceae bacterium]NCA01310.1 siroheme synthase [Sphingomonadaceae bacterium]
MHSLPVFIRLSGRPVILLGDGDAASAKRRLLERAGAMIVGEDAQAALAIVAIEDDAEAEAAIARLKARGVLVNAVDRAAACDFTLPAIVDRDPVIIAIGTGGASAGLAKALRQRLEALMPATLGGLAQALGTARAKLRARWPDGADRRRAIDAALDPGGPLDPFGAGSAEAVATWLQSGQDGATANFHHIKVHSDDPDDLTLAQARILARADLVLHQARVAPAILDRARADATRQLSESPPADPPSGMVLFVERL